MTITAPFRITSSACGTTALAANSSCQVLVEFAPTEAGPIAGTLTFSDGAGMQTVALTGIGTAAPTDILNPVSLSFDGTAVGALSAAKTISLTNTGDEPLTAIEVTASGDFQTSNNCGTQLAGKAACVLSVTFAPTRLGSQSGTLTVSDALRSQTVSLIGIGLQPPMLSVSPLSLIFSTQPGVPSTPQTVTVTNTGDLPMDNLGFQFTDPAAASYSLSATTCGATLAASAGCTVQVVFSSVGTGTSAASLTVSSSTLGVAPVSVYLNGAGHVPGGVISNPTQVTFTTVGVGQSSAAVPVTISNTSGYELASMVLAVNGPFTISQSTCTSVLAAGANCSAALVFQPAASGSAGGELTVSSTALASPVSVALSGMGFDFSVGTSGVNSLTISAGQTASYAVKIEPSNGATGTFTYVCGTLPANALYIFNPPSTTVNAGVTGNVTVQIAAGKSGSARLEGPVAWQALPMLCGLLLLPLALVRAKNNLFLALLVVLIAGGVSSCTSSGGVTGGSSGGSGGAGGSSATPPGTYTIPVTISSTGVSHAVTLTLTVD